MQVPKRSQGAGPLVLLSALALLTIGYQNCSGSFKTALPTAQSSSSAGIYSGLLIQILSIDSNGVVTGSIRNTNGAISQSVPAIVVFDGNPNSSIQVTANIFQSDGTVQFLAQIPQALFDGRSHSVSPGLAAQVQSEGAPAVAQTFSIPALAQPLPAPTIKSFAASPSSILQGASTTLSWTTVNANIISITPITGKNLLQPLPTTGSIPASPNSTTTYTLTASGPGGSQSAQVTVNVGAVESAKVLSFTALPISIKAGNSVTLSWATQNASSITISPDVGVDTSKLKGSITLTPKSSTTYTLTAIGAGGNDSATQTVTVNAIIPPSIGSFTGDKTWLVAGDSFHLSWSTQNATAVTIVANPIELGFPTSFTLSDSVSLSPVQNTTYTLIASGENNTVATATFSISVVQPPPPTILASPYFDQGLNSGAIRITTQNATSVTVSTTAGLTNCSPVPLNGSCIFSPTPQPDIYTFVASGPGGQTSVTVNANQPAPLVYLRLVPGKAGFGISIGAYNTTSLEVSPSIGLHNCSPVPMNGVCGVDVAGPPVTYTFIATGPAGKAAFPITISTAAVKPVVTFSGVYSHLNPKTGELVLVFQGTNLSYDGDNIVQSSDCTGFTKASDTGDGFNITFPNQNFISCHFTFQTPAGTISDSVSVSFKGFSIIPSTDTYKPSDSGLLYVSAGSTGAGGANGYFTNTPYGYNVSIFFTPPGGTESPLTTFGGTLDSTGNSQIDLSTKITPPWKVGLYRVVLVIGGNAVSVTRFSVTQ